jgi:hypothetical protein
LANFRIMATSDNTRRSTNAPSDPNGGLNLSQGSTLVEDDAPTHLQVSIQQEQQDDEMSAIGQTITTSAVDTTTIAFVLGAMPSKPSLLTPAPQRESKAKKWEVDAPVSAKVNKAGSRTSIKPILGGPTKITSTRTGRKMVVNQQLQMVFLILWIMEALPP